MVNKLSTDKRAQIVSCLCDGVSISGAARITGAAKNTIMKLLVDLGAACAEYQDGVLVDLPCKNIQCDEIWSFCYSKQKNIPDKYQGEFGYGDIWTWTALCSDTKLVPSWLVGERTSACAEVFLRDLESRLASRVQLTTDGYRTYVNAVEATFGADIDYAMLHKSYDTPDDIGNERRYSPAVCTGMDLRPIIGNPDLTKASTSFVERQNLTMRMGMRRFTRLTNAFSKKVENLTCAVSLHYMHYNFARPHTTLTKAAGGYPTTPAMAASIEQRVWTHRDIAALLD